MSDVEKLRALLVEARQYITGCACYTGTCDCDECCDAAELDRAIDAALAEPRTDDHKRGAEAMREAAAREVSEKQSGWQSVAEIVNGIRALPIPEDKR